MPGRSNGSRLMHNGDVPVWVLNCCGSWRAGLSRTRLRVCGLILIRTTTLRSHSINIIMPPVSTGIGFIGTTSELFTQTAGPPASSQEKKQTYEIEHYQPLSRNRYTHRDYSDDHVADNNILISIIASGSSGTQTIRLHQSRYLKQSVSLPDEFPNHSGLGS